MADQKTWEGLFKDALRLVNEIRTYGTKNLYWTFGGGTVLMRRYQHRLSKDIDIFVPDPQALTMWLDVDGHRYQNGNTSTMVFGVAHLVSYLSRFMSLQPGDIISTGTPPGVGLGQKPPVYLRPGDVVTLGGRGLGEQRQTVVG